MKDSDEKSDGGEIGIILLLTSLSLVVQAYEILGEDVPITEISATVSTVPSKTKSLG
jgi:hypothetical protein